MLRVNHFTVSRKILLAITFIIMKKISFVSAVVRCSGVWSPVIFFFDFLIITVGHPPHEHVNTHAQYSNH